MNPTIEALMRAQSCIEDDDQPGVYVGPHRKREVLAMLAERIDALQAEQGQEPYAWELLDQGCRALDDCEDYLRVELAADINAEELARFQRAGRAWPLFKQPTPPAEQWVSVKERLPDIKDELCIVRCLPHADVDVIIDYSLCDAPHHYTHWMRVPPIDSTDAGDKQ